MMINIFHYDDVIMGTMASQITSLAVVYAIVYSDEDQRKHQSSASLAFVWGIHRGQMASYAENVSIWWRHHVILCQFLAHITPSRHDNTNVTLPWLVDSEWLASYAIISMICLILPTRCSTMYTVFCVMQLFLPAWDTCLWQQSSHIEAGAWSIFVLVPWKKVFPA